MQCVAARYERKGQQLNTQHAQRRGAGIINTPWPLAVPSCSFIQAMPPECRWTLPATTAAPSPTCSR